MIKHILLIALSLFFLTTVASAQKADITVTLGEPFFDSLLDALLSTDAPDFPIGERTESCAESIKVRREMNGSETGHGSADKSAN